MGHSSLRLCAPAIPRILKYIHVFLVLAPSVSLRMTAKPYVMYLDVFHVLTIFLCVFLVEHIIVDTINASIYHAAYHHSKTSSPPTYRSINTTQAANPPHKHATKQWQQTSSPGSQSTTNTHVQRSTAI